MTVKQHGLLAVACVLLLLSPLGAPALGIVISTLCPLDATMTPDGPFAIPLSYCGFSRPVEHYFQEMVMLPLVPFWMLGLIGGIVSLAWIVAAFALLIFLFWNVRRMIGRGGDKPDL